MSPSRQVFVWCVLLLCFAAAPAMPSASPVLAAEPRTVDTFDSALPSGTDTNGIPIGFFTAQDPSTQVAFASALPPAPIPGESSASPALEMTTTVVSYGVVIHGFENAALDTWVSQDWSAYAGMSFWLYGQNSGTDLFIDLIDNRNPGSTKDDAERFTYTFKDSFSGWQQFQLPFDSFTRKEIGNGAPNDGMTLTEVHGYALGALTTTGSKTFYMDNVGLYGTAPVRPLTVGFTASSFPVVEGETANIVVKLSKASEKPVKVFYTTEPAQATAGRDYTTTSGVLTITPGVLQQSFPVATLADANYEGEEGLLVRLNWARGAILGQPNVSRVAIQDAQRYSAALIDDFERQPDLFTVNGNASISSSEIRASSPLALPGQDAFERVLQVSRETPTRTSAQVTRELAGGQDWSGASGLGFWFYGQNTGKAYRVYLNDNQAPDPGPSAWQLAWSDEFNTRKGTAPDASTWTHEIGDGTTVGNPGWGNSELEYYTDSTQNAATDGKGNLVITLRKTDERNAPSCYYGPCKYTSARLISANKAEFAYGRIESRIRIPRGTGLWPAFWMLGSNIGEVAWPQSGEIDIMENVGRLPNRVFGTIHGPGYNGGQSFGNTIDLPQPVADEYHTFSVEWQPNRIVWYIDGVPYHEATPDAVSPNPWVFNHSFFIILNVAIGGNFGGAVGSDATFPQSMAVDYVRVYQPANTAERFEASFVDNFQGWQQVSVPFSSFTRSSQQPTGAPNDGLTLTSVSGYGFGIPAGTRRNTYIDRVQLQGTCVEEPVVSTTADTGSGSLRNAISRACEGATVSFAPELANSTVQLSSQELTLDKNLTIDGSAAPGVAISGGGSLRVFVVDAAATATIRHVIIRDGYGFELAGGILNNGALTLEGVTVEDNTVTTSGQDFWKGGAGIYNGDSSSLVLRDSSVRNNTTTGGDGGGIYGFFHSQLTIERSTLSGNSSSNVGGGMRTLGNASISNSTFSGNQSLGWHGGAIFHTDGVMSISNSTIASNSAPNGAVGGVFVGTFTEGSPTMNVSASVLAGNSGGQCVVAPFGSGTVTLNSGGDNLVSDGSCSFGAAGDQQGDPLLGPLANNGGPTQTHALLPGSPALDAATNTTCPATDQRGIVRPQGAACDKGAVEREE